MKNLSRRNFLGNMGTMGAAAIIAPAVMASTVPSTIQIGDSFKPLGRKV